MFRVLIHHFQLYVIFTLCHPNYVLYHIFALVTDLFTVSYVQFDAFIKLFLFKEKKEILIHYFKMIKIIHYSKEFLFLLFCI